jgi:membrane fusion protein (multidrug efflux system)
MALKRLHTVVAVLGIGVVGAAAWWWQNRGAPAPAAEGVAVAATGASRAAPGGGPVAVEIALAKAMAIVDDVQAVGSLKSAQGVMLRPEVSGRVAQFGFSDGQRVRRGQLLVQLDDTLQRAQLRQAEAQASIARTNLQRSRELLAQGFVSPSAVDQNAAALEVADAQVALANAQLARMKIVAPFDATTGIRRVDIGDYVKDGADLVNLEDLSSLAVDFSLPERTLARLKNGQVVEITLDALPGKAFTGRVVALDSQVDTNGRSLLVRAQVDNAGSLLKPGMFARARVVLATRDNAVVVPEEALVPLGGRQYVYRIVDGVDGQKVAERVEARIGLRLPGQVELLGLVAAGDTIVTAGQTRLRGERAPVRVVDLARPPAAGPRATGGAASASGTRAV